MASGLADGGAYAIHMQGSTFTQLPVVGRRQHLNTSHTRHLHAPGQSTWPFFDPVQKPLRGFYWQLLRNNKAEVISKQESVENPLMLSAALKKGAKNPTLKGCLFSLLIDCMMLFGDSQPPYSELLLLEGWWDNAIACSLPPMPLTKPRAQEPENKHVARYKEDLGDRKIRSMRNKVEKCQIRHIRPHHHNRSPSDFMLASVLDSATQRFRWHFLPRLRRFLGRSAFSPESIEGGREKEIMASSGKARLFGQVRESGLDLYKNGEQSIA